MIYCIVGDPLSGKTTISKKLSDKFKYYYFSTGEYARSLGMKNEQSIIEKDLSMDFNNRIREKVIDLCKKNNNLILDGFPRSKEQILDLKANLIQFKIIYCYINPVAMYERAIKRKRLDDEYKIIAGRSQASTKLYKIVLGNVKNESCLFFDVLFDNINQIEEFIKDA